MKLHWEFSLGHRRHTHDNGDFKNNAFKFVIHSCTPTGNVMNPKLGYDLFHWGKKIHHGKSVKKLKQMAEILG